jgi:RNA polymerase sigma-70 factor, ECF subfamily
MDGLIGSEQLLALLTSHQRRLVGFLRTLVPNRSDSEEILQEVNLYIWRHADEFQPGSDFMAWALQIARFRVLEWRKRRSRDRLVFDDSLVDRLAMSAQSLDVATDRRQEALETCLEKLAPHDHELITRLYGDPKITPQGLAEGVGRSTKGIYVSLNRIRLKLLDCIQRALAAEDHAR